LVRRINVSAAPARIAPRSRNSKQGNQTERELTTVLGWTAVDVTATLIAKDGHTVVEKKVTGRVRFRGDNLKVTDDIAKKVTKN